MGTEFFSACCCRAELSDVVDAVLELDVGVPVDWVWPGVPPRPTVELPLELLFVLVLPVVV